MHCPGFDLGRSSAPVPVPKNRPLCPRSNLIPISYLPDHHNNYLRHTLDCCTLYDDTQDVWRLNPLMAILKISLAAALALIFLSFANLADSRHVRVVCSGDRPTTMDTSVRPTSQYASPLENDIYDYSGVGGFDQEALIFAPGSSSSSSSDAYSGSDSDSRWTNRVLGRHAQRDTDLINIVERVLEPDRPKLPTEKRASRTRRAPANTRPTPEPTGPSSRSTTVHIRDARDFALLLPDRADGE